ncbi:hypothetical protein D9M68_665730 [compost metagenome]
MDLHPPGGIEVNFERKNTKKLINHPFNAQYPFLVPGPYFWRNVIIHPDPLLFSKFSDFKIETGKIDENKYIRPVHHQIILTKFHVFKNGSQVQQNFREAHKSHFGIMFNQYPPFGLHFISAKIPEDGLRILLFKRLHQVGTMQISGSFSGNEIVVH